MHLKARMLVGYMVLSCLAYMSKTLNDTCLFEWLLNIWATIFLGYDWIYILIRWSWIERENDKNPWVAIE